MKKYIKYSLATLIVIIFLNNRQSFGQTTYITDDFEDNDISDWTQNNANGYTPNTLSKISGTYSLRHNSGEATLDDYIYKSLGALDVTLEDTYWQFNFKKLSFNPTSGNHPTIWLMANETTLDESSGTIDGYVLSVDALGETDDLLRLYKVSNGIYTVLISSDISYNASLTHGIKVTRNISGDWELFEDADGDFDALVSKGTATDNTYTTGSTFGFFFDHTLTNQGKIIFDDIDVVGTAVVACSEPTTAASGITFTCKTTSSMTVSWTNGDGANRIVVVRDAAITAGEEPVDGTTYTANTVYGTGGTEIGSGYVVYNSSGNSVTVTGLSSATTYYFAVFELGCSPEDYLISSYPTNSTATLANNEVFINEIHYDNSGADADEGVEIAGPAGTDLSCFDIVFYNGGTGASYSTLSLSGTIDDEGCGYGAVWFAKAGIQNDMDGMALVSNGVVIQFLSYEGSFTATDGPANGMTSTDIGVDEEPAPASGNTIQLLGYGTIYSDFYWVDPVASSLGSINTGQDFCPPTQLTFTSIPISCRAVSQTFSVTVCATNASEDIYNPYTGTITVSKASGTGTLSGTLVKAATSGCATFADLSFDAAGAKTLDATDGSLTDGTSDPFTISASCSGAGIIINEFSNGPAGNQEYVELLVVGTACSTVDIRGFIVDDNNGSCNDGFGTKQKESGVAVGYIEFDAIARWASVPVGSIILIYNNGDKNPAISQPDDPDDTGTPDFVYILPASDGGLIRCPSTPNSAGPTGDCTYSPCATGSPASWSYLAMRNSGDAIQVRNPDETYYHGISYGNNATYNMTGGPDDLNVLPSDGTGKVLFFNNADYRNVANFSDGVAGTADETPGEANTNTAGNAAYISSLRCGGETCADGIQNQDETDVDCGGVCPDVCHCINGIEDAGETGIDCGDGADCPACPCP